MAPSATKLLLIRQNLGSTSPPPSEPPPTSPQGPPQPQQISPVAQVQASVQKWFSGKSSIFRQRSQAVKQASETKNSKTLEKRIPEIVELCNC